MNTKEDYIGVFDSGVGGISVLRHLRRVMPNERFLYYGDSANAPYGIRTRAEVRDLSFAVAEKLMARGLKALVIRYPGGGMGVMATPMTLSEEKFARLLHRYDVTCDIYKIPAPRLVEIVEAGMVDTRRTIDMLQKLFTPYRGRLDALVLGCTHYPFASHTISRILGGQVDILDGGDGTARETRRRLEEAGLLRDGPGEVIIENSRNSPEILGLSWRLLEGKSRTEDENHGK